MKINFITFGSHGNFINAGNRLIEQAEKLNVFSEIILYTGDDLKKNPNFFNLHEDFINKNRWGFGYWIWKPYIIKKNIEKMNNGDILLYLDSGCEIDYRKKEEFLKLIDIVKNDKIIGSTTELEKGWNKMDLIEKLDMNKEIYLNSPQRQGGTNLFLVCDETRKLVNEWYELSCDYHNIDDTPSIIKNLDCFVEHRHDQAVYSLLSKKYNLFSKHCLTEGNVVHIRRNNSNISKIDF